ncbi:protein GOS9-like [Typha latifolia]|uniref:protein GOS9-like n=1 Tax=Typha latifolia TaxID=4733 RepID=UPI003C307C2E
MQAGVVKVGKWGGDGGGGFDMGAATRLANIRIRHGAAVDAIQIMYEVDGKMKWSTQFGGNGGGLTEINLKDGEFLTSISGNYGSFGNITVIRSLSFTTNLNTTYGPYGEQQGTYLLYSSARGVVQLVSRVIETRFVLISMVKKISPINHYKQSQGLANKRSSDIAVGFNG